MGREGPGGQIAGQALEGERALERVVIEDQGVVPRGGAQYLVGGKAWVVAGREIPPHGVCQDRFALPVRSLYDLLVIIVRQGVPLLADLQGAGQRAALHGHAAVFAAEQAQRHGERHGHLVAGAPFAPDRDVFARGQIGRVGFAVDPDLRGGAPLRDAQREAEGLRFFEGQGKGHAFFEGVVRALFHRERDVIPADGGRYCGRAVDQRRDAVIRRFGPQRGDVL